MAKPGLSRQSLNPDNYYEYQPEFGVWSVHFENHKQLSIDKITKIFKKYGSVKNVSQTGSPQGYCFISFWNREDARNCAQQISHDGIMLRSFSPKIRLIKDRQLDTEMLEVTKESKKPVKVIKTDNDSNNNSTDKIIAKDETKKFEKYYEAKSVFFANPRKLSEKKVRAIFSKYGYIETVQQTGYPTGWCFVRFGSEQFARDCAIDVMSKGIIQLGEFKSAAVLRARKQGKMSGSHSVTSEESNPDFADGNSSFDSNFSCNYEQSGVRHFGGNIDRHFAHSGHFDENGGHFERDLGNGGNFECNIDAMTHDKEESREEMIKTLKKFSKIVPNFVQKVIMTSGKSFYVPMDARVPWKALNTVVVEMVPATGVIVANLHGNCRGDFLLKLFAKYEPIFVSKIKDIGAGNLNYCHVYVKTDSLARAAVMHYDNIEVFGKRIIVARPEALIAGGFQ